eukprot:6193572-Pleurochrysis_carterae.AAC.1
MLARPLHVVHYFAPMLRQANNPNVRAPHLKHKYSSKLHDYTERCGLLDAIMRTARSNGEVAAHSTASAATDATEERDQGRPGPEGSEPDQTTATAAHSESAACKKASEAPMPDLATLFKAWDEAVAAGLDIH